MTHAERKMDKSMKFIILLIILTALLLAEALHAQTKTGSKFSAKTLRIGVENFLHDRLEETDEFTIGNDIQDQGFDEQFVVARCDASAESLAGNTKIALVFSKNGNVLRRAYVPVQITLKRNVPILARAMQRGEIVTAQDVEYKLTDVTHLSAHIAENFVGMRLVQNVSKGTVLTAQLLVSSSSIQRGDIVNIVIQSGEVTVRASGTSLDDAKEGQTVRVRRDDTTSILTGIAGGNKSVMINIPQNSPSPSSSQR